MSTPKIPEEQPLSEEDIKHTQLHEIAIYSEHRIDPKLTDMAKDLYDRLLNNECNVDEAKNELENIAGIYRKNLLKRELVLFSLSLKEILEKIAILEEYQRKTDIKISNSELNLAKSDGYRVIAANLPLLVELNHFAKKEFINVDEFNAIYNRITIPLHNMNHTLDLIAKNTYPEEYVELIQAGRVNLSRLPQWQMADPKNEVKQDVWQLIESVNKEYRKEMMDAEKRLIDAHIQKLSETELYEDEAEIQELKELNSSIEANDWRENLCFHRMNQILQFDGYDMDDEMVQALSAKSHLFHEYFDVNANQIRPEYAGYSHLENAISEAKEVLARNNLLMTYKDAVKEPDLIMAKPVEVEKKVVPAEPAKKEKPGKFAAEQKKLEKLTEQLRNAGIKIFMENRNKSQMEKFSAAKRYRVAKQFNRLEQKIKEQQSKLNGMWDTYENKIRSEVGAKAEAKGRSQEDVDNAVPIIVKKKKNSLERAIFAANYTVKVSSETILPDHRKLVSEAYLETKKELEKLLIEFGTAAAVANKDSLFISHQEELKTLYSEIVKKTEEINKYYAEMKDARKSFISKLKGGELLKLVESEKQYVQELQNKRLECSAMLEDNYKKAAKMTLDSKESEHKELLSRLAESSPSHKDKIEELEAGLNNLTKQFTSLGQIDISTVIAYEHFRRDMNRLRDEVFSENHEFSRKLESAKADLIDGANVIMGSFPYQGLSNDELHIKLQETITKLENIKPDEGWQSNPFSHDALSKIDNEILEIQSKYDYFVLQHIVSLARYMTESKLPDLRNNRTRSTDTDKMNLIKNLEAELSDIQLNTGSPIGAAIKFNRLVMINQQVDGLSNKIFSENRQQIESMYSRINEMDTLIKLIQPYQLAVLNKDQIQEIKDKRFHLAMLGKIQTYDDRISCKILDETLNRTDVLEREFKADICKLLVKGIDEQQMQVDAMLTKGLRSADVKSRKPLEVSAQSFVIAKEILQSPNEISMPELASQYKKMMDWAIFLDRQEYEIISGNEQFAAELQHEKSDLMRVITESVGSIEYLYNRDDLFVKEKSDLSRLQSELDKINPTAQLASDQLSYRELDGIRNRLKMMEVETNTMTTLIAMKSVLAKEFTYLRDLQKSHPVEFRSRHLSEIMKKTESAKDQLNALSKVDSIEGRQEKLKKIKNDIMPQILESVINRLDDFIASVKQGNTNVNMADFLTLYDDSAKMVMADYAAILDKQNDHYQVFIDKFNLAVTLTSEKHLLDVKTPVVRSLRDIEAAPEPADLTTDRSAKATVDYGLPTIDAVDTDQLQNHIVKLNARIANIKRDLPTMGEDHIFSRETLSGHMVSLKIQILNSELKKLSAILADYSKRLPNRINVARGTDLVSAVIDVSKRIDECENKVTNLQLRYKLLSEHMIQPNRSTIFSQGEHEHADENKSQEKKMEDVVSKKSDPGK